MKNYWDEIHPEYSFLTSKLLRDQASRVVKNKVVMATEYRNEQDTNIVPLQDNEILVEQHPQEDNMNKNLIDNTNVNVESDNNEITETDLYKTLNDIFIQKINEYSTVDVNNRPYLTSINKKPSAEELKTIDFIATKYINSLKCNGDVTLDIIDNVIYSAAIAIRTYLSDLSEKKNRRETPKRPKWLTNLDQKVTKLRKTIAHINVVLECKRSNNFTRHQLKVRENLHRKFGNTKSSNLHSKLNILKQELKATSSKIRYQEKKFERNRINRKFTYNPKNVYRDFKNDKMEIETIPPKEDIEKYWKDIWTKTAPFNDNAAWIKTLQTEYCVNATQKDYVINSKTLKEVISKLQNNKSPGIDGIIGYWFKNLNFYINDLVKLLNSILNKEVDIPTCFTRAKTKLIAKSSNTHQADLLHSAYNKHLAHNTFALPVLTPTFGILDWTIPETENLDIAT